jgi:hypothetical protein
MDHPYALRAPWYVRERDCFTLRDPRALRPAIQMYDTDDFVDRVLEDPRDSLKFDDEGDDVWSYPVAVTPKGHGRARFVTHVLCRSRLRKLYQPTHDRFYLVIVELFCDAPGLPRAGEALDIEVGMVLRRRRTTVSAPPQQVRRLARQMAGDLLKAQHAGAKPGGLRGGDLPDVLWADLAARREFEATHADELAGLTVDSAVEAWLTGPAGGRWGPIGAPAPEKELELPMWRLPPRDEDCAPARTRSLWFGLVPTFSADMDTKGTARLDDRAIYEIHCFARKKPEPGHEHCPPKIWWSAPTEPFRLAAVFDPDGTKNHKVNIKLPDFRTVAARAGQPPGPGGVAVTSPPGSQMQFNPFNGIPAAGSGRLGGDVERICVFAFELFIIVGFFVFLLFLPIVVFLFQLWWMLALRFCLPPQAQAFTLLQAHFDTGTLITLPEFDKNLPNRADRSKMDELFGATGVTAALAAAEVEVDGVLQKIFDPATVKDLLTAVNPAEAVTVPPPVTPEDKPDDPLCPRPAGA